MRLVSTAVSRPVTVWMFTLAVALFGFVSLSRLAINLLPDLSYPTLTIRTDYVGAAPGEVEQLISKPIEEAVGVVRGVRDVTSISKAGQSDVVLQFEWGTEMEFASLEVREKLDILELPLDVQKPLLLRFNPNMDPIVKFGFGLRSDSTKSETASANAESENETPTFLASGTEGISSAQLSKMKQIRTYAEEQIKRKLESVEGVASVQVGGGLEKEIHVYVVQQRLSQLGLSIQSVVTRLKDENINASGGRVEDGSQAYLVRTLNQFTTLEDMRNLYVATVGGKHVRLSDIAQVTEGFKQRDAITRFNGAEGVEIAIYKEGDANTVQVAQNIQARLKEIEPLIPDNLTLQLVYDQATFISNAIEEVKSAAIIGGVLAMLVLFLFLKNIWPTLVISISIPVSIIATFNLMYGNDISLNIMSLGGIALAIGLLVDNSIVVLENIDRHKLTSKDTHASATKGTQEVSTAIVASTLTTMAVFFPLVFVEGIAGQLFRDQALTVTFALAASLVVALTLIPMLAAREKRSQHPDKPDIVLPETTEKHDQPGKLTKAILVITWPVRSLAKLIFQYVPMVLMSLSLILFRLVSKALKVLFKPLLWAFDKLYATTERMYARMLEFTLKAKMLVVSGVVALCASSLLLLPKLGMDLIPPFSQGEFFVEVTLPAGSQVQKTDTVLDKLAVFAASQPGVSRTYSLAGTGSLMNASPSQGGDYWGKLNVVMTPESQAEDEERVQQALRQYLQQQPGVISKFGSPQLFSFSTPLEIIVSGYDLTQLKSVGDKVVQALDTHNQFTDVKSSLQLGKPELKIQFDHGRLAQVGLNAADVSRLIATKVGGDIASQFSIDDRKVDILVRTSDEQRDSIRDIAGIIVNPGMQPAIPLSAIAEITSSVGPSEITRNGQQRVVVISANLAFGDLGEAATQAREILQSLTIPPNLQVRIGGQNEEMQNSFVSLKFALALAVFLVYLVMASQFESLMHPFIILFTVPLAGAGSIFGLYLTGTSVSVVVFIGLIMLSGIVVNNAIVLIDRINQLRAKGTEKIQAIKEAASSRLRPIMMTTLTTALGLLPLAVATGEGAEIRAPMAITVIFGLLFASALTLLFIPAVYSLVDRKSYATPPVTEREEPVYG